jgi:hypothetical protein
MPSESVQPVTELLRAAQAGDAAAAERLMAVAYEQLHQLARARMAHLPHGQTLQPTALVHEAYLRLADKGDFPWESRRHFFFAAARAAVEQAAARAAKLCRKKLEEEAAAAAQARDAVARKHGAALEGLAKGVRRDRQFHRERPGRPANLGLRPARRRSASGRGPGGRRLMGAKRRTRQQVSEAIELARGLLLQRSPKHVIKAALRHYFGGVLSARSAERYVSRARDMVTAELGRGKAYLRALSLASYEQIVGDPATPARDRINALTRIDKLMG